ncbi:MAG: HAAS signaling domain-containing protein [Shewanella sp.]
MDLVDRYIAAVQRELPEDKRQEIGRELKANICDQLDALAEHAELTESQIADVLKQMGHPAKVARQFVPPTPIVASDDIPLFKHTLVMVLGVLFVLQVVSGATQWLGSTEGSLLGFIRHIASGFIVDACFAFTAILLSFWSISAQGKVISGGRCQHWQPQNLPKVGPDWQHISLSDVFSDLATYLFLLLLIWNNLWMSADQLAARSVIFSANAQQLLQWFSPIILLSLLNTLWQLRRRLWTAPLLLANAGVNLAYALCLVFLAFSSPLLQYQGGEVEGIFTLQQLDTWLGHALLVIALFPSYECIRDILRWRKLTAH